MINQLSAIALATVTTIGFMPSALAKPTAGIALTEANYRLYIVGAKRELLTRENLGAFIPDDQFKTVGNKFCSDLDNDIPLSSTISQFHLTATKSDATLDIKRQLREFYTVTGIYAAIALCPK